MASVEGRAETLASVHSTLRESFLASDIAENPQIPRSLARVTLAAVLNNESKSPSNSNVVRTLLDIIRAEETLANHPNQHHQFTGSRTTWRSLKDRLKLRRNTGSNPTCSLHSHSDWMPTASAPQPDATAPEPQLEVLNRSSVRDSLQMADSPGAEGFEEDGLRRRSVRLSDALAAEREERSRMSRELEATAEEGGSGGVNGGEPAREQEPIRMSLMDLLEESERHSGIQGPMYSFDDGDDDEAQGVEEPPRYVNEEDEKGVAGVSEISCCVCMVRHKGAAFIPCGHTFCRMCSRELWVQRGHCPLCNSFILEVLDIF